MNKDELKKMRLENLRKAREARRAKKAAGVITEPAVTSERHSETVPNGTPPPLPPLNPPPGGVPGSPLPGVTAPVAQPGADGGLSDQKLKEGLASVFQSGTAGLANAVNLAIKGTVYRVEFTAPSDGESALWAEFALPVLKQYMPDLQNSPVKTLVVFTAIILSGKIQIVQKLPVGVDGGGQNESNSPN